ncbi:NfeD family protein [Candidatus Riflebacteria bacterium]
MIENLILMPAQLSFLLLAQQMGNASADPSTQFTWGAAVILLFIFGLVLFFLEVFLIPGVGIAAILSFFSFAASVGICFYKFPPVVGFGFFFLSVIIVGVLIFWVIKIFPKTSLSDGLIHKTQMKAGSHAKIQPEDEQLLGKEGEIIIDCRPIGKAMIENKKWEVLSDDGGLKKGDRIKVVSIKNNQVRVELVEE